MSSRGLSRYHVAMMMELKYGLGLSYRAIQDITGVEHASIFRALKRAVNGAEFPEVTGRFISFDKRKINRELMLANKSLWAKLNAVEASQ